MIAIKAENAPSEAEVKAAFLLNFPKYVEWPPEVFAEANSPIVIAIFGGDKVADLCSAMSEGKVINGHPVRLVRLTEVDQCRDCQILFVGSDESRRLPEILAKVRGSNVLTVGESDNFIEQGGIINLVRRDRRVVLEVNLDGARQTELKISSKLLAVATVIGGKK
jgi:hypothetical protein